MNLPSAQHRYHRSRFPLFIRIVSAILIIAFIIQDIAWADPDKLQVPLRTTNKDFKLAFNVKYMVDKARQVAELIDSYNPASLNDIVEWDGASDFTDVSFRKITDGKGGLKEVLIRIGNGDVTLRYFSDDELKDVPRGFVTAGYFGLDKNYPDNLLTRQLLFSNKLHNDLISKVKALPQSGAKAQDLPDSRREVPEKIEPRKPADTPQDHPAARPHIDIVDVRDSKITLPDMMNAIGGINTRIGGEFRVMNYGIVANCIPNCYRDPDLRAALYTDLVTFVAIVDGAVAGYVIYDSDATSEVQYIAVDPDMQDAGVGSALMNRVFELAISQGKDWVAANSSRRNLTAHKFYRDVGKGLPGGVQEDKLVKLVRFTFRLKPDTSKEASGEKDGTKGISTAGLDIKKEKMITRAVVYFLLSIFLLLGIGGGNFGYEALPWWGTASLVTPSIVFMVLACREYVKIIRYRSDKEIIGRLSGHEEEASGRQDGGDLKPKPQLAPIYIAGGLILGSAVAALFLYPAMGWYGVWVSVAISISVSIPGWGAHEIGHLAWGDFNKIDRDEMRGGPIVSASLFAVSLIAAIITAVFYSHLLVYDLPLYVILSSATANYLIHALADNGALFKSVKTVPAVLSSQDYYQDESEKASAKAKRAVFTAIFFILASRGSNFSPGLKFAPYSWVAFSIAGIFVLIAIFYYVRYVRFNKLARSIPRFGYGGHPYATESKPESATIISDVPANLVAPITQEDVEADIARLKISGVTHVSIFKLSTIGFELVRTMTMEEFEHSARARIGIVPQRVSGQILWMDAPYSGGIIVQPQGATVAQKASDEEIRIVDITSAGDPSQIVQAISDMNNEKIFGIFKSRNKTICEMVFKSYLNDPNYIDHISMPKTFVAFSGDRVVGYVIYDHGWESDSSRASEIEYLAVDPDFSKSGIGTRLVHAVFDFARSEGTKSVIVFTESENRAARALYRKVGSESAKGFREMKLEDDLESVKYEFYLSGWQALAKRFELARLFNRAVPIALSSLALFGAWHVVYYLLKDNVFAWIAVGVFGSIIFCGQIADLVEFILNVLILEPRNRQISAGADRDWKLKRMDVVYKRAGTIKEMLKEDMPEATRRLLTRPEVLLTLASSRPAGTVDIVRHEDAGAIAKAGELINKYLGKEMVFIASPSSASREEGNFCGICLFANKEQVRKTMQANPKIFSNAETERVKTQEGLEEFLKEGITGNGYGDGRRGLLYGYPHNDVVDWLRFEELRAKAGIGSGDSIDLNNADTRHIIRKAFNGNYKDINFFEDYYLNAIIDENGDADAAEKFGLIGFSWLSMNPLDTDAVLDEYVYELGLIEQIIGRDRSAIHGEAEVSRKGPSIQKPFAPDMARVISGSGSSTKNLRLNRAFVENEVAHPFFPEQRLFRVANPALKASDFYLGQPSWGKFEMFITEDGNTIYVTPALKSIDAKSGVEYFAFDLGMESVDALLYRSGDLVIPLNNTLPALPVGTRREITMGRVIGVLREAISLREEVLKHPDSGYFWIDQYEDRGVHILSHDILREHSEPRLINIVGVRMLMQDFYTTGQDGGLEVLAEFGLHTPLILGKKLSSGYKLLVSNPYGEEAQTNLKIGEELTLSVCLGNKHAGSPQAFSNSSEKIVSTFLSRLKPIGTPLPSVITVEDTARSISISFTIDRSAKAIIGKSEINSFDTISKRSMRDLFADSEELFSRRVAKMPKPLAPDISIPVYLDGFDDVSNAGDKTNPFILEHIRRNRAVELFVDPAAGRPSARMIRLDRKNPRAPHLEEEFEKNGLFNKIKRAKDRKLLMSMLVGHPNFRNLGEEERIALVRAAETISLSVILDAAFVGKRTDASVITHVRTGYGRELHGLGPTVWIGELLLEKLTDRQLARLLLEECQHVIKPPALVDGRWINRHGRISDQPSDEAARQVIEHDEKFAEALYVLASEAEKYADQIAEEARLASVFIEFKSLKEELKDASGSMPIDAYHDLIRRLLCSDKDFVSGTLKGMGLGSEAERFARFDKVEVSFNSSHADTRIYKISLYYNKDRVDFAIALGQISCGEEMTRMAYAQQQGHVGYLAKIEFDNLKQLHDILPDNVVEPFVYTEVGGTAPHKFPVYSMRYMEGYEGSYVIYSNDKYRVVGSNSNKPFWQMVDKDLYMYIKDFIKIQALIYIRSGEHYYSRVPFGDYMCASRKAAPTSGPPYVAAKDTVFRTVPYDSSKPMMLTTARFGQKVNRAFVVRSILRELNVVNSERQSEEEFVYFRLPLRETSSAIIDALEELFPGAGRREAMVWLTEYIDEYGKKDPPEIVDHIRGLVDRLSDHDATLTWKDADKAQSAAGNPRDEVVRFVSRIREDVRSGVVDLDRRMKKEGTELSVTANAFLGAPAYETAMRIETDLRRITALHMNSDIILEQLRGCARQLSIDLRDVFENYFAKSEQYTFAVAMVRFRVILASANEQLDEIERLLGRYEPYDKRQGGHDPAKGAYGAVLRGARLPSLNDVSYEEISTIKPEEVAALLFLTETIDNADNGTVRAHLDAIFGEDTTDRAKLKETFFYMLKLARSNREFRMLLLQSLRSPPIGKDKATQMNSSNMNISSITFAVSDDLPIDSARYFDPSTNRALIIFNSDFFNLDVFINRKDKDSMQAALHVRAERIMHELRHDNHMGGMHEERDEEASIISAFDVPVWEVTQRIGIQNNIDDMLRRYPKVNEAMHHSGSVFRMMPGWAMEKNLTVRGISVLRYVYDNVTVMQGGKPFPQSNTSDSSALASLLVKAGISPKIVAKILPESIVQIFEIVANSALVKNEKARRILALFPVSTLGLNQARSLLSKLDGLYARYRAGSTKPASIEISPGIELPEALEAAIRKVITSDFSNLIKGVDYDSSEGRNIYINVTRVLGAPLTINGKTIKIIKIKGASFDSGKELKPFEGLFPLIIKFGPDGEIIQQLFPPKKPTGAMTMDTVDTEYDLIDVAYKNNGSVGLPLAKARYTDASYQGNPIGVVVVGIENDDETDMRSALANMTGGGRYDGDAFVFMMDPQTIERNRRRIIEFMRKVGGAYKHLHDSHVIQGMVHMGNIMATPRDEVRINDFEYGTHIENMTISQEVAHRTNDIRGFFTSLEMHLNPNIILHLARYFDLDIRKEFLAGYLGSQAPPAAFDYTTERRLHDLLADIHINATSGSGTEFIAADPFLGRVKQLVEANRGEEAAADAAAAQITDETGPDHLLKDEVLRVLPLEDQNRIDTVARFIEQITKIGSLSDLDFERLTQRPELFNFESISGTDVIAFVREMKSRRVDLAKFDQDWEEASYRFLISKHPAYNDAKWTPQLSFRIVTEVYRRRIPVSNRTREFCAMNDKIVSFLFSGEGTVPSRILRTTLAVEELGASINVPLAMMMIDRIAMYAELKDGSSSPRIAQTFLSYFMDNLFESAAMAHAFMANRSMVEGYLDPRNIQDNDVGIVFLMGGSSYIYEQALQIARARGLDESRLHSLYVNRRIVEGDEELLKRYIAQEGLGKYKTIIVVDVGFHGTMNDKLAEVLSGMESRPDKIYSRMIFLNEEPNVPSKLGWNNILYGMGMLPTQKDADAYCFMAHILDSMAPRNVRSPVRLTVRDGQVEPVLGPTELPIFAEIAAESIRKGTEKLLEQNLGYPYPDSDLWDLWMVDGAHRYIVGAEADDHFTQSGRPGITHKVFNPKLAKPLTEGKGNTILTVRCDISANNKDLRRDNAYQALASAIETRLPHLNGVPLVNVITDSEIAKVPLDLNAVISGQRVLGFNKMPSKMEFVLVDTPSQNKGTLFWNRRKGRDAVIQIAHAGRGPDADDDRLVVYLDKHFVDDHLEKIEMLLELIAEELAEELAKRNGYDPRYVHNHLIASGQVSRLYEEYRRYYSEILGNRANFLHQNLGFFIKPENQNVGSGAAVADISRTFIGRPSLQESITLLYRLNIKLGNTVMVGPDEVDLLSEFGSEELLQEHFNNMRQIVDYVEKFVAQPGAAARIAGMNGMDFNKVKTCLYCAHQNLVRNVYEKKSYVTDRAHIEDLWLMALVYMYLNNVSLMSLLADADSRHAAKSGEAEVSGAAEQDPGTTEVITLLPVSMAHFNLPGGERCTVRPMDRVFADMNAEPILALVNEVEGSSWDKDKLLEEYPGKWDNSFAILNQKGEIISILIAYEQDAVQELRLDFKHIFIRRICTDKRYRLRGLAKFLLGYLARHRVSRTLIALQTNVDNVPANILYSHLDFYKVATIGVSSHKDNVYVIEAGKLRSATVDRSSYGKMKGSPGALLRYMDEARYIRSIRDAALRREFPEKILCIDGGPGEHNGLVSINDAMLTLSPGSADAAAILYEAMRLYGIISMIEDAVRPFAESYRHEDGAVYGFAAKGFFVPTPLTAAARMLKIAGLREGQKFLDLGSGLGDVVFLAASLGADSNGIEFDNELHRRSIEALGQLRENPSFRSMKAKLDSGDYLADEVDLSEYDVLYWYANDSLNANIKTQLKEKIARTKFRSGTKLVVYGDGEWDGFNLFKRNQPGEFPPYCIYEAREDGSFLKAGQSLSGVGVDVKSVSHGTSLIGKELFLRDVRIKDDARSMAIVARDRNRHTTEAFNLEISSRAPPTDNDRDEIVRYCLAHRDVASRLIELFPRNIPLYIFNNLKKDLFGFARKKPNLIALYGGLYKDDNARPVALFHEMGEYILKDGKTHIEISKNRLVIFMEGERIELDIREALESLRATGEPWADWTEDELNNPQNRHYILRILQRAIFGAKDIAFTQTLREMKPLAEPVSETSSGSPSTIPGADTMGRGIGRIAAAEITNVPDDAALISGIKNQFARNSMAIIAADPNLRNVYEAVLYFLRQNTPGTENLLKKGISANGRYQEEFLGEFVEARAVESNIRHSKVIELGMERFGPEVDFVLEVNSVKYASNSSGEYSLPDGIYLGESKTEDRSNNLSISIESTMADKVKKYELNGARMRKAGFDIKGMIFAIGGSVIQKNGIHKFNFYQEERDTAQSILEMDIYVALIPDDVIKAEEDGLNIKERHFVRAVIDDLIKDGLIDSTQVPELERVLTALVVRRGVAGSRFVLADAIKNSGASPTSRVTQTKEKWVKALEMLRLTADEPPAPADIQPNPSGLKPGSPQAAINVITRYKDELQKPSGFTLKEYIAFNKRYFEEKGEKADLHRTTYWRDLTALEKLGILRKTRAPDGKNIYVANARRLKEAFLGNLRFRPYSELPEELKSDQLYMLIKKMHTDFHIETPDTAAALRTRFDDQWQQAGAAEYSDAMIAFVGDMPVAIYGFSKSEEDKVAWAEGVYTDSDYRGRGVADAVRDAMFDYLKVYDIRQFKIGDVMHINSGPIRNSPAAQELQKNFMARHPEAITDVRQSGGILRSYNIDLTKYLPSHKYIKHNRYRRTGPKPEEMMVVDSIFKGFGVSQGRLEWSEGQNGLGIVTVDSFGLNQSVLREVFDIRSRVKNVRGKFSIISHGGVPLFIFFRPHRGKPSFIDLTVYYSNFPRNRAYELSKEAMIGFFGRSLIYTDRTVTLPYTYAMMGEDGFVGLSKSPASFKSRYAKMGRLLRPYKIPILPGVFESRHSSSMIAAKATMKLAKPGSKVLIIGSGIGIDALVAAANGATVDAVDINDMAVENTSLMARREGAEKRINVFNNDIFNGLGKYDLIIFNMPHLPDLKKGVMARSERLPSDLNTVDLDGDLIKRFAGGALSHLTNGGCAVVVNSKFPEVLDILRRESGAEVVIDNFGVRSESFGYVLRRPGEAPYAAKLTAMDLDGAKSPLVVSRVPASFIDEFFGDPWHGYNIPIYGNPEEYDGSTPSRTQDTLGCATLILGTKDPGLQFESDDMMYSRIETEADRDTDMLSAPQIPAMAMGDAAKTSRVIGEIHGLGLGLLSEVTKLDHDLEKRVIPVNVDSLPLASDKNEEALRSFLEMIALKQLLLNKKYGPNKIVFEFVSIGADGVMVPTENHRICEIYNDLKVVASHDSLKIRPGKGGAKTSFVITDKGNLPSGQRVLLLDGRVSIEDGAGLYLWSTVLDIAIAQTILLGQSDDARRSYSGKIGKLYSILLGVDVEAAAIEGLFTDDISKAVEIAKKLVIPPAARLNLEELKNLYNRMRDFMVAA